MGSARAAHAIGRLGLSGPTMTKSCGETNLPLHSRVWLPREEIDDRAFEGGIYDRGDVTPGHCHDLRARDARRKLVRRSGATILSTYQNQHRTAHTSELLNI